jgi:uncharacterized membrane protein YdjX (TVP38/TMEM64 family)
VPVEQARTEPANQTPTSSSSTRRPPWSRWGLALLLLAAVGSFYALGLHEYISWEYLRGHLDQFKASARQNPALALLIFVVVCVAATALSMPAAGVLLLAAGALFGRWIGAAVVSLAATIGATLAFLSSRYLFRDWVRRRLGARLMAFDRGIERDGAYYLLTLRLVPVFPFFLINLGMGLTPMRAWTFARVTLLGMLPVSWVFANAGTVLASIESPEDVLSPGVLVSLLLLALLPLGLRALLRRPSLDAGAELQTETDEPG